MLQTVYIMQSVLCESSSEIEKQICRAAPFTDRQFDDIFQNIEYWYLMMKPLLEGSGNLCFMKETIKSMIRGDLR